jgi:hypothetical protein
MKVLSDDHDASRRPSVDQMIGAPQVSFSQMTMLWPVAMLHIRVVLHFDFDASKSPSGDQATDLTEVL